MPKPSHAPRRTVRIEDDLWNAAKRKASDEGRSLTAVIVWLLKRWLRGYYD